MDEVFLRIWENLADRLHGPLVFRLLLQPAMALFFAIRDGLRDARDGREPYFLAIITDPARRNQLLRDGWKSVARVFILAIAIDVVYQVMVFRWVFPGETLIVATFLALIPYVLVRGPVNRLARRW